MKKIGLGVQELSTFKRKNLIYVDKTEIIHRLINDGSYYFLSRPRRFGKSLLVDTIKELFEGNKELFESCWIYDRWNWEDQYTVLKISFTSVQYQELGLKKALDVYITNLALAHGIQLTSETYSGKFLELIQKLGEAKPIVILVDEYDKPIIDYLEESASEKANENRKVLKTFYSGIKDLEKYIQFLFITGVSKFSRVSIFSDLNHLTDITIHDKYSQIVGYSVDEVEQYYKSYLERASEKFQLSQSQLLNQMKIWYDGYSWDGKHFLYNPYSVLSFFDAGAFKNFWFETGTPTFLIELISKQEYPILALENLKLEELSFSYFDIDLLEIEPLLFQTGYLTIKGYDEEEEMFQLSWPNQEVKKSFLKYLFRYLLKRPQGGIEKRFLYLSSYLKNSELEEFIGMVNTILASIPYQHIAKRDEFWFHAMFYLMLSASGAEVFTEMITSKGRLDIAVLFPNKTYVIELKCNQTAKAAIKQIKDEGYADRYSDPEKELILMGLNFDSEKREITDWDYEPKVDL